MDLSVEAMTQRWDAARDERRRVLVELIASRERVIGMLTSNSIASLFAHTAEAPRYLAIQRERLARDVADLVAFDTGDIAPAPHPSHDGARSNNEQQ